MTVYAVADRVGVVIDLDDVYVARLPDGPILSLTGAAALVWRAALDGPTQGIADRVAAAAGLPVGDIADDVTVFVETLLAGGLLVEAEGGGY
jgi:hypothetical protein